MKSFNNDYTIEVLVKGKPVTEYQHEDEVFIEGRKSSSYEIKITNNTYRRILAITSVDGLNVVTGKPASSTDSGYVLTARQSVTIPGWTLDRDEVAKFIFSANDKSYSAQSGQGESNLGIIGVKIFNENVVLGWRHPVIQNHYNDGFYYKGLSSTLEGGGSTMAMGSTTAFSMNAASGDMAYASAVPSSTPLSKGILRSMAMEAKEEAETIGTGFGKATEFATTTTSFDREDAPARTLLVRYDTRKNLEARGIELIKPKKAPAVKPAPQAFPGDACAPPPGWKRS